MRNRRRLRWLGPPEVRAVVYRMVMSSRKAAYILAQMHCELNLHSTNTTEPSLFAC